MSAEFPFTSSVKESSANDLPTFRMLAWDFKKNQFLRDNTGEPILLEGNDALKIWIEKAIRTERYSWLAYSFNYGSEIKTLIGSVLTSGERESELRRFVIECLMVNPYIKSVESVTFDKDKNGRLVNISVNLTTIYGKITV